MSQYDYDWLVIGSGFGGSVSALRLAEKGYKVGVLECGKRFGDKDFPKSTWDVKRYFWAPRIGLRGIFRLTTFKDVSVVSGCGVGGGSLGYANTLYVPPSKFFKDPQWADLADWERELAPHYAEAQRMLGVVQVQTDDAADDLLREYGEAIGVGDTYQKTPVGIFFGEEPGKTVPDPFFGGEGPDRTGCSLCGRCMVGCPHGAKNTLVKNYLWLAEQRGVEVTPDRTVTEVRPLGAADGSDGYAITSERSGVLPGRGRRTVTARGVVVAAGALGTNKLLQRCRLGGALPKISARLGELVRTNSEMILAVTVPEDYPDDLTKRVAISGSIYPDADTHIETVSYGKDGDSMSLLYTLLVGDGTRVTRPLKLLAQILRHPLRFAKVLWPKGWSRRTIILLVMQTLDNAIALRPKLKRSGNVWLQTEQDPEKPNPTFIPVANDAAEWLAERTGGVAQSSVMEALMNIPTTAHILGGAVIGHGPEDGVVDARQRVFGYENLLVCDGSAVPANVGVNPSLTITALAEHAMSEIPAASEQQDYEANLSAT
ncbi:MAG TPA: GMC family oxidoreductase [Solirubrobacterales bacterium]|nr:GMC family oxidoreductase [Solirubrobacterales bacterium]